MDTQFVSDLMTQFNNNHGVPALQGNVPSSSSLDTDLTGNEAINIVQNKTKLNIQTDIPKRMPMPNVPQSGPSIPVQNPRPNIPPNISGPRNINTNIPPNKIAHAQYPGGNPIINNTVPPRSLDQEANLSFGKVPPKPMNPEAALNQIPRNLSNGPKRPNIENNVNNANDIQPQANVDVPSSDFYSIFGFQLSKMTVYIIIAFIAIIAIYYVYKYFTSSSAPDKDKRKRKPEVSYDQQVNPTEGQDHGGNEE